MKSVLISIQPKWCELIANGKKTVEVRKTRPKIDVPFKGYIYCTRQKVNGEILLTHDKKVEGRNRGFRNKGDIPLAGKVIGEFVCDKIEQGHILWVKEQPEYYDRVDEKTQLTYRQMFDYLGEKGIGYFWHISDLVIYEQPKELSEFHKVGYTETKESVSWLTREEEKSWQIKRPPRSWCYVEGVEGK